MATYKELLAQRLQLDAQIEKAKSAEVSKIIAEVKTLIAQYELTARDLGLAAGRQLKRKAEARYIDPKSGSTWSGLGREPGWIKGKDRNRFLVKGK
ncbi:H-NS family nucleoid-associated regulatory protein [Pandoraea cepalis]|uniref:DNA-binding protein n=1 Tax=Pandoraea cepalis TaxID=2508294 RepID=A0A5E4VVW9_9BURK|nr:H-NS histone family protein [Pandoraea cepalis]VVE15759.1 DNA-binding protein [Pandoraea cepalis]